MSTNKPEIQKKYFAFDYIVLKLVQWYCEERKYKLNDFNNENDFGVFKVLHFPFFISTANGKNTREILFKLFDNFIPDRLGNVENDIKAYIFENSTIYKIEANRILIKIQDLRNHFVSTNYNDLIGVENVLALDKSISVLKEKSKMEFVFFDWIVLRYLNQKHSSWRVHSMSSSNDPSPEKIPNSALIDEQSMYAADDLQMVS